MSDVFARIDEMMAGLADCPPLLLPSEFWESMNSTNMAELRQHGYENFKRTLATHYFTFILLPTDPQVRFLLRHSGPWNVLRATAATLAAPRFPPLPFLHSKSYAFMTHLLWAYASRVDRGGVLSRIRESEEGNPPPVYARGGRLISQDLANSALEFLSIDSGIDRGRVRTILELGAGYGRTAAVFLTLMPEARYLIVDIPPALAISERYLSSFFPGRRIFRYRPFRRYEDVREELESSDVAFLLPQQMELLPERSVDLFLNISSLHEMRPDQIGRYFEIIDRIVSHAVYLKQWRVSKVPPVITERDYPIAPSWTRVYHRPCAVQTEFFEALYILPA